MPFLSKTNMVVPLSSAAALAAVDISNMAAGVTCNVTTLGLFGYNPTSVIAPNNITVIQPTTGNGRWISLTGKYNNSALFSASVNPFVANATGDGTIYTVINNSIIQNIGENYNNTTGIFTAPVTGNYLFNLTIDLLNLNSAHNYFVGWLLTTTRQIDLFGVNPFAAGVNIGAIALSATQIAFMNALDTCAPQIQVSGGTKTVTVNTISCFSGTFLQ